MDEYKAKYLDQKLVNKALKTELCEMLKAIERYRKLYADVNYVKLFGREVSLDFEDPLYPYCPYRLTKEEMTKFLDVNKN